MNHDISSAIAQCFTATPNANHAVDPAAFTERTVARANPSARATADSIKELPLS